MKKIITWISLLFTLVLVLIGGVVIFILTLDPNDYRDDITQIAARQGVKLEIAGDLSWKLYPELVLVANQTSLEARVDTNQIVAQVNRLDLALKLMPLLKKQIQFRGISISGADTELHPISATTPLAQVPENAGADAPEIVFQHLNIDSSKLTLFSESAEPLVFDGIELESELLNFRGESFPLALSFRLGNLDEMRFPEPVEIDATLTLTDERVQVQLSSLQAQVATSRYILPIETSGDFVYNTADQSIAATNVKTRVDKLDLSWNLLGRLEPLALQGYFQSSGFNPAELLETFAIPFTASDPTALRNGQFSSDVVVNEKSIQLSNLQLKLDDSSLQGGLTLTLTEIPSINFVGKVDTIDLNRYLPATQASAPAAAAAAPSPAPYDATLAIEIAQVALNKLKLSGVSARIDANEKRVSIENFSGKLASGDIKFSGVLGMTGASSINQFNVELQNLLIGELLTTMTGATPITGQFSAKFVGDANGDPADMVKNLSGNGSVSAAKLILLGVDVEGMVCDISDRIQRRSLTSTYGAMAASTALQDMSANISVTGGMAQMSGLTAAIGNIKATGNGRLDLTAKQYRADFKASLAGTKTSETGCTTNQYLRDRVVPMVCTGTLAETGSTSPAQPSCGVDTAFIQDTLKQIVTQGLTEQFLGTPATGTPAETPTGRQILDGLINRILQ